MVIFDNDGYPGAQFIDEPDNRRPLFTDGPIENPRDLVPALPEPISAEALDVLHALRGDADNCPCIDDWAENSMFESGPNTAPNIAADDNSDIDNFLREYHECRNSGSKPVKNSNSTGEHSSSATHPNNSGFSAAPANANGFDTSSNHTETTIEVLRPLSTSENPNLIRTVPNSANMGRSTVYSCPQPGRLMAMPDTKKETFSKSKVICSPGIRPKSRIARTPTKANIRRRLGAPEVSPTDEKKTQKDRIGKSNPLSRKWATEAKTAPSISTGESSSKLSNADTEGISSEGSDTTSTNSSKSRGNSSSSDSTAPDTSKGPPPAPKYPPAPGSGGPGTRSKSATANRAANGNNSVGAFSARRSANRERYMSHSKSCPVSASGPQNQSGLPGNGGDEGNSESSSNSNGENSYKLTAYRSGDRYFDFVTGGNSASGVEASAGGFDVPNDALWQNVAPLPVMNGGNGSLMDGSSGPGPTYGPLVQNCQLPPYEPLILNCPIHSPTTHNDSAMHNGPILPKGAAMQNASMPKNILLTYHSQMHSGPMPPYVLPTKNGSVPSNGFPMQNGKMPLNSAQMQNFQVPQNAPLMRNDPMPPHAPQMQNGAVPPNGCLTQNGPIPQYNLPIHNGTVLYYGPPIQNSTVPSCGPLMHNETVQPYGFPMNTAPMQSFVPPMQNGTMPVFGPPMQNAVIPAKGGYFIAIPRNGFGAYVPNGPSGCAPNGPVAGGWAPNGHITNGQGPNGSDLNASVPNVQVPNGDDNNR